MKKEEYLRPFSSYSQALGFVNDRMDKALTGLDSFRNSIKDLPSPLNTRYKSVYEKEIKAKHKEAVKKMVEYIELLADDNIEITKYLKDEFITGDYIDYRLADDEVDKFIGQNQK